MSYTEKLYAESLSEFGTPLELPESGGWLLKRHIPGSSSFDAMGSYPLFACKDWTRLHHDFELLKSDLVSVSLVTDPFGNHTEDILAKCFPDKMIPFKEHFIIDLSCGIDCISAHHKRNARKALATLEVEVNTHPLEWLDEWVSLYEVLIRRHKIHGISAFSKISFSKQLQFSDTTAIRGTINGKTVGMLLWCRHQDVAYYHLGAYNEQGYQIKASFALFSVAIEHYRKQGVQYLSLGAGAGLDTKADDGLTRFKSGWSSETRTAYLCGRVINHGSYDKLVRLKKAEHTAYFPAYRLGEFGNTTNRQEK